KSGKQRPIGLPLIGARWSPDGQSLLGQTTPAPFVVAICPVDGTSCRQLAPGRMPVWSADASRIYFLRDTAAPPLKELWTMTPDGGDQRRVFDRMGPYRAIDVRFDFSRKGEIIWGGYIEGRHELWQATLRPGTRAPVWHLPHLHSPSLGGLGIAVVDHTSISPLSCD